MNKKILLQTIHSLGLSLALGIFSLQAYAAAPRALVVLKTPAVTAMTIGFAPSLNLSAVSEGLRKNNFKVERQLLNLNSLIVRIESNEELARLRANPLVAFVDEEVMFPAPKPIHGDYHFQAASDLDMFANGPVGTPWGIKAVRAQEAWTLSRQGQGARVVVLDTGIDKDHPALIANFEKGSDFIGDNNQPYAFADHVGHGSHVAGTIAGSLDASGFSGVAPSARILMGRVCSEQGCSSLAIAAGIEWAIQEKADIVSMSLGGGISPPGVRMAVQKAEDSGVIVVAASGNDGSTRVSYPAALPTVIAVGAVDAGITRANFSQYGPELAICAPGVEVLSSVPQGTGRLTAVNVRLNGAAPVAIANAAVQGAGQFTGTMEGDLVSAGLGRPDDFTNVQVKGKVALIGRGTIPFTEKVINALHAGAIAVLIYNNEPGLVRGGITPSEPVNIPVFIIEQTQGAAMKSIVEAGKQVHAQMQVQATDYAPLDGTSMATPHVAGVLALVRATNKNLTPAQVRDLIRKSASPMSNNSNNECGSGLVNAAAAVTLAKSIH